MRRRECGWQRRGPPSPARRRRRKKGEEQRTRASREFRCCGGKENASAPALVLGSSSYEDEIGPRTVNHPTLTLFRNGVWVLEGGSHGLHFNEQGAILRGERHLLDGKPTFHSQSGLSGSLHAVLSMDDFADRITEIAAKKPRLFAGERLLR